VDGTNGINGIKINNGNHDWIVRNCEIKNSPNSGILTGDKALGTGNNQFLNCNIHDNGSHAYLDHGVYLQTDNEVVDGCQIYNHSFGYGVQIFHDSASKCIVRNNSIHDISGRGGIIVGAGSGHQVYNNVIYNCAVGGIRVQYGGGGDVYNNTIYGGSGYALEFGGDGTSMSAKNNIIYGSGSLGIMVMSDTVANVVLSNNLSSNNLVNFRDDTGRVVLTNNKIGNQYNPRFTNPGAGSFLLQTGSDAIDAGMTISSLTRDFAGTARPRGAGYDIGAYEF